MFVLANYLFSHKHAKPVNTESVSDSLTVVDPAGHKAGLKGWMNECSDQ